MDKPVYVYAVTLEEIRENVTRVVEEMEEDEMLECPDDKARAEFIEDCTECICDDYYNNECSPVPYVPDYDDKVASTARLYGWTK